jgi:hypothetical protein
MNKIGIFFEAVAFAESGDFETARLILYETTLQGNKKIAWAEKRLNISAPRAGLKPKT